jgi:hypothetical protein
MVRIFLSWSGPRSRAIAEALNDWLPRVNHHFQPWFSPLEIKKGERWSGEIGAMLAKSHTGVLCITQENHSRPWICFEAGALSKQLPQAKVIPLLFGLSPADLDGPLSQFQCATLAEPDMLQVVQSLNAELGENRLDDEILRDSFRLRWPKLRRQLERIATIPLAGTPANLESVVRAMARFAEREPELGNLATFDTGFENHGLYGVVTALAKKRLYVFGRKNRKLFDKTYAKFFRRIADTPGFDLRILFLDPDADADVIKAAHADDEFPSELKRCIGEARKVLSRAHLDPSAVCRFYRFKRPLSMVVVDDAVLYRLLPVTADGKSQPITDTAFSIANATSRHGSEILRFFTSTWTGARPWTP